MQPPLNNIQSELLKLFSAGIPENYLLELKHVIARFLLEKGRDEADKVWDEKIYSNENLQRMLDQNSI